MPRHSTVSGLGGGSSEFCVAVDSHAEVGGGRRTRPPHSPSLPELLLWSASAGTRTLQDTGQHGQMLIDTISLIDTGVILPLARHCLYCSAADAHSLGGASDRDH